MRIYFTGVIALSSIFILQACSTAKVRIMPGNDGVNRVVSRDIEKDDAEEAAVDKANDYCEDQDKHMVVIKEEKTSYNGSMDENKRKTIRNASKAAVIMSGPAGVMSDSTAVGGVLGGAGTVGYTMTSDRDYEAQFTFRCK